MTKTSSDLINEYKKIEEIVANNPDITAEEFGEKIKKERINTKITDQSGWTLFYHAIRSEGPGIEYNTQDRVIFLKMIELFTNLSIGIHFKDTASRNGLGIAGVSGQADVIKILLDSGKFNKEEKVQALNLAIIQGNVEGFKLFLDHVDYADTTRAFDVATHNEQTDIMKVLLDNNKFTKKEKVNALSNAGIDGNAPKVKLLLDHMTGIPEDGKRTLLEIIKASNLSLKEKLKIDSDFKGDPNNPDHREYFSNRAIIKLLENAINKEQSTSSSSNGNASSRPIATVTPMSTTVNGQLNNNNENVDNQSTVTPTEQNTGADGFISGQFSVSKEAKYKENKKDFYTSLGKDIAGIIATGLLITAAVMVPFVAGTIIFGVLAALVAIGTFIHVLGNTLPSHDEMKGNQIEHTGFQEARYKG